jgi:hypothetical protein
MKTTWLVGVIVIMTVVSALGLWGGLRGIPGLAERHRLEGVFAPAYDEAGEALYFLHRETRGRSDGGGRTFYVTYREVTYEVTVQPRRVSAETTTRGS